MKQIACRQYGRCMVTDDAHEYHHGCHRVSVTIVVVSFVKHAFSKRQMFHFVASEEILITREKISGDFFHTNLRITNI